MPLGTVLTMRMGFVFYVDWNGHETAMPDSPFGDNMFGEMLDLARPPAALRFPCSLQDQDEFQRGNR